jgi:hypothetical protein
VILSCHSASLPLAVLFSAGSWVFWVTGILSQICLTRSQRPGLFEASMVMWCMATFWKPSHVFTGLKIVFNICLKSLKQRIYLLTSIGSNIQSVSIVVDTILWRIFNDEGPFFFRKCLCFCVGRMPNFSHVFDFSARALIAYLTFTMSASMTVDFTPSAVTALNTAIFKALPLFVAFDISCQRMALVVLTFCYFPTQNRRYNGIWNPGTHGGEDALVRDTFSRRRGLPSRNVPWSTRQGNVHDYYTIWHPFE